MTGEQRDGWCPQEELAVGWALRSLEPDDEARLRAHLPGCARCREVVRDTEEVAAALGGSVRQYDPPARLKAKLMAAVERTPQERVARESVALAERAAPVVPPGARRPRQTGGPGRRLLVAAAVVVAVVAAVAAVGVTAVRVDRLDDRVAVQEQRNQELTEALALASDPGTNRAVLRAESGDPVAIVLSAADGAAVMEVGLAPNDARDQTYVVWGASTPEPVPLATFDVSPDDGRVRLLSHWTPDAHKHTRFGISLEQGRTAPAKPSAVLASGQVGAS
ncbi:anti-sigma factor [Saccharothrix algeriensis]|uniref:Regulator of SigK n=1 Tax=Saccharothrix algeriensis TaxID=173560 RepID=A0A8T8I0I8_9PSEU|nr:anti-sigma factor [Saccharothrix algeriensis]